jgi:sugar phosphate permease
MLPLLVSACFAPLLTGCLSDRMGGRRKPLVLIAGVIMILCNIALAFNRSFGWLPYIGILFGAVRITSPSTLLSTL